MQQRSQQFFQRKLYHLDLENKDLKQENASLKQKVHILSNDLKQIKNSNLNTSISSILKSFDQSPSNNRLQQLEYHIKTLNIQVQRYKEINRDLEVIITEVNLKLNKTLVNQSQKQMEIQRLKHKIQELKVKQTSHTKHIAFLNQRNNKINDEKRELKKQKQQIDHNLKEQSRKNHDNLIQLGRSLRTFTQFKTQGINSLKNINNSQQLQQIIQLQQQQLQERNKELHKLRSICQGQQYSPQQTNLKNTIKHLKLQLNNYKKIIKDYTLKLSFTQKIITKYSSATQNYQKQIQKFARLQQDLLKSKLQNEKLNNEIHQYLNEILQKEQANKHTKGKMIDLMTQNQACHYLLYQKFGDNFKEMVNNYKDKEMIKRFQRSQADKWTNVQELIDVNLLLRQRLKI